MMNKLLITTLAALTLAACSSTWSGAKDDASRNWDKTQGFLKYIFRQPTTQTIRVIKTFTQTTVYIHVTPHFFIYTNYCLL